MLFGSPRSTTGAPMLSFGQDDDPRSLERSVAEASSPGGSCSPRPWIESDSFASSDRERDLFHSVNFYMVVVFSDIVPQLEIGKPEEKGKPTKPVNGIFWILLLNLAIFVADHLFQMISPSKLVEEEEGSFGLWVSYIVTGVGANLVSWLVLPRSAVSMGASGAVFGLFAISVLVRLSWNWRKILEVLILGQFVIDKVMEAAQASIRLPGAFGREVHSVNHIAHFSGALIGVALILLIAGVPSKSPEKDVKALKGKNKK
ncbi:hypothetical protein Taro_049472 [Colocasia esculenta]|uniref:Peptidase S54 rhomboid domain-containing protein n=1 Tax=Colocasia esculenta TaxID=4460 RepID=A0A843XB20_COLES|nr:hypothetical protein [Colocasia esculenta]